MIEYEEPALQDEMRLGHYIAHCRSVKNVWETRDDLKGVVKNSVNLSDMLIKQVLFVECD